MTYFLNIVSITGPQIGTAAKIIFLILLLTTLTMNCPNKTSKSSTLIAIILFASAIISSDKLLIKPSGQLIDQLTEAMNSIAYILQKIDLAIGKLMSETKKGLFRHQALLNTYAAFFINSRVIEVLPFAIIFYVLSLMLDSAGSIFASLDILCTAIFSVSAYYFLDEQGLKQSTLKKLSMFVTLTSLCCFTWSFWYLSLAHPRQFLATSLVFLSLALALKNHLKISLIVGLISVSVHGAALLLLPIILPILLKRSVSYFAVTICFFASWIIAIIFSEVLRNHSFAPAKLGENVLAILIIYFTCFFLLALITTKSFRSSKETDNKSKNLKKKLSVSFAFLATANVTIIGVLYGDFLAFRAAAMFLPFVAVFQYLAIEDLALERLHITKIIFVILLNAPWVYVFPLVVFR
jgi:hypothetical protein